MRITIDTKEDSREEIRRVLHILSGLVENKSYSKYSASPRQEDPADTTNMMSMFSDNSTSTPTQIPPATDSSPDFTAFIKLAAKKREEEKKQDEVKIEFF